MTTYLGDYQYGATVYIPFASYNSAGASVTLTGLAVTDIEVYKDGSITQRASDAGYTLLDTDGIDFDALTGIHGFSIDTSDNTTAGFWGPGHEYFVVVSTVTIDGQTVSALFQFSIENRHESHVLVRTTIASLSSQTSFTITAGSADDNAYNGCDIVIYDQASVVQKCIGVISDYTGSSKTVTLLTDPAVFTMANGDYVTILADRSLKPTVDTRTLGVAADGDLLEVNTLTGHTAQTGDSFARLGAPAGASVSADILAIDNFVDTEITDIQARLPAALTGAGNMKTDALAVNGSTTAAARLALSAARIVSGAAVAGTLSTTQMTTDLTEATDDHYNGRIVIWTSGVLVDQAAEITDYTGSSKMLTYTTITEAPSAADTFIIV